MKKSILASIFLAVSLSAFSLDFGGMFLNNSTLKNPNPDDGLRLDQKDSLSAWLKVPLASSRENYFAVQGIYQFEGDFAASGFYNALDVNLLKFAFRKNDLSFSVGRFPFSDNSGKVLAQAGDGFQVDYANRMFDVSAYAFYTGLLNSQFVDILDEDFESDKTKVYDLCPAYFVGGAKFNLPFLFAEQSLFFEGIFSAKVKEQTNMRMYAEIGASGPVVIGGLYYKADTILGFSKYEEADFAVSNLTSLEISYYFTKLSGCVSLKSVYASGGSGIFKAFNGFTSQTAVNSLESKEYSSLFKNGVEASVKPLDNLLVRASCDVVVSLDEKPKYDGFQFGFSANYQIFSDLMVGCDADFYIASDSDNSKTEISLKAAVVF